MAATKYPYNFTDFLNDEVDLDSLDSEIRASAIITALDKIETDETTALCDIWFKDALSAGDNTVLDGIVAAHDGVAIPDPLTPGGVPLVHIDAPEEDDGKPVVVMTPGPRAYRTFFSGSGDDPSPTPPESGRGSGPTIGLDIPSTDTFPKDYFVEWGYNEPVYVHDGQLCWNPAVEFGRQDHFSLSVKGLATVTTPNGTTTGNCNLVAAGGYNVIVPAAGDGTHDVVLADAVPVPTGLATNGYWDVDKRTGDVTPSLTPGAAKWLLLDIAFQSYFLRRVPLLHSLGLFDIDTYMAEWISVKWTWRMDVHKEAGPSVDCEVAGWIYVFREFTN